MLLPFLIVGCTNTQEPTGNYKDGEYTTTAKGKNGKFTVHVIISNGSIQKVSVGKNQETPSIGQKAIAKIIKEVINTQNYDVDVISGATRTSNGLKKAIKDCLIQASE